MDSRMTQENDTRILIADDDPISRRLLQRLLQSFWKGTVLIARDGQEAWETLEKDFCPLVIMDWMMPRMDGTDLCRKIRAANFDRYIYCILLTARDDQNDVLEGLKAGADDYVRKPFNPQELQLRINAALRMIHLQTELAAKNAALSTLNARLEELARIDPLMKISNRHSLHEAMERIHYQFTRYHQNYGLLMCDVDFFKQYNDTMGHQAGDRVLEAVAGAIKHTIRQSDEAFRYGGEEIVVVLSAQDVEGAIISAERLCQTVRDLRIPHPKGLNGTLSISIGVTACSPENRVENWTGVLEQADQALYHAKKHGRNQVCAYRPQPVHPDTGIN
jgi:two-component system, cell cycle response regulator